MANEIAEIEPKDLESLVKIYTYEKEHPLGQYDVGWGWSDVGLYSATINHLLIQGFVKCTYSSRSHKNYLLTDTGKALVELSLKQPDKPKEIQMPEDQKISPLANMFEDIIGYDDIKELIRESMQLQKPIHVLLQGPPSVAKTMFLSDIERAGGEQAVWMLGSATSKAGLWETIIESRPKYLLIDEIDKMAAVDHASLLSLMEKGRLTRTKVGKKTDLMLTVWVFASANRIDKIPPELLSRFSSHQLSEYNSIEYYKVVQNTLVRNEGISESDAIEIARYLIGKSHDVRDAVRVARLSTRVGVKRAAELLIK